MTAEITAVWFDECKDIPDHVWKQLLGEENAKAHFTRGKDDFGQTGTQWAKTTGNGNTKR